MLAFLMMAMRSSTNLLVAAPPAALICAGTGKAGACRLGRTGEVTRSLLLICRAFSSFSSFFFPAIYPENALKPLIRGANRRSKFLR